MILSVSLGMGTDNPKSFLQEAVNLFEGNGFPGWGGLALPQELVEFEGNVHR